MPPEFATAPLRGMASAPSAAMMDASPLASDAVIPAPSADPVGSAPGSDPRLPVSPVASPLAAHIRSKWESARRAKTDIEEKMLRALRQRVGEYDPSKVNQIRAMGSSDVFIRATDLKCAAASAWIRDVLSLDRPWGLSPTPNPQLPPGVVAQIQSSATDQVMRAVQQGTISADPIIVQNAVSDLVEKLTQSEARRRASRMEGVIDDYLRECDFSGELGQALDWDFVTFGTAILRAPVVRVRRELQWTVDAQGQWSCQEVETQYPAVERVSPLDFYPSDDATSIDDASYLLEKYPISRASLAALKGVESWNSSEIDAVLTEHGNGGLREWTSVDSVRADLAERVDGGQYSEKLDALIYWGELQGKLLRDWGLRSVEPLAEYAVEAWLIGGHVVRVEIKEPHMLDRPYQKAVYRHRPGSFWGVGIPELMEDAQTLINAAARALANNMAFASGPQVGVDLEQMPVGEDGSRIWPWKVWRFNTGKFGNGSSNAPPITFFQPDMHALELMQIYERWTRIADEITNIPAYVQGTSSIGGAGNTASGLSMLMGAATKGIKAIIGNVDTGIIEPLIRGFFRYAMLYYPDDSIKGDCQVDALGSTRLLVREQNQIRRNEFLQATNNPVDLQIMGVGRRAELLRGVAESLYMEPDDIAPTREEMEQQLSANAASAASPNPAPQAIPGGALPSPPSSAELGPDGQPVAGQDFRLMTPGG